MDKVMQVMEVTQRFSGLVALSGINMSVCQGEIVGVIGPNGAGKTTLFNIITGIYHPTQGKVLLQDTDITGKKLHEIAKLGFARTFQNIRLFSKMTALDNVMLGMHTRTVADIPGSILHTKAYLLREKESISRAEQILELLGIYPMRYHLASNLSYGLQRKLEIARALASKPKLLLLDEPAAGMNEQETEELMHIVSKLRDMGNTILLIEHDMRFVMNICDRIYVLDHGVLIADGTPEEVSQSPEVISAYLGKEEEAC